MGGSAPCATSCTAVFGMPFTDAEQTWPPGMASTSTMHSGESRTSGGRSDGTTGRSTAERCYALYREQFNPDLTVPAAVVEEWISVERLEQKEKITAKPQQVVDETFAERAPLIIEK